MNTKRMVILGGGESGTGAAILAKVKGFDVFLSDRSPIAPKYKALLNQYHIPWEEGTHTYELILNADEVVKSPGIPDKVPVMQEVLHRQIPVISEIELAARYTPANMICITGSNGKTTTTLLTYHILKQAGLDVGLAGNVGQSLALQVATADHTYYVVELSSFQLDNMYEFKADIAILLNITPDHLDRYDYQMQHYVDAKFRIIQNQQPNDAFIYWAGDPILQKEIAEKVPTATCYPFGESGTELATSYHDQTIELRSAEVKTQLSFENPALQGKHNMLNAMAASQAALLIGLDTACIQKGLETFEGVEHRLERVKTLRGVTFINDSKATNVNSCWYALQSMKQPVTLILGGVDKGNDYSEIMDLVKEKVHNLIFLGTDHTKLHTAFGTLGKPIFEADSMQKAIQISQEQTSEGEVVLLSPCCASFDLFKSYEDRGRQFKSFVNQLV